MATDSTHPTRSLGRRAIRFFGLAVLGLLGLWLGVNVLLNTPIAPWLINRQPEKWSVDWDRAWMTWPEEIHVRGFTYRQRTRKKGMVFGAEQASARLRLLRLLDETFRVEELRGSGLSVEIDPQGGHGKPRPPVGSKPPGFRIELAGIDVDGIREFRIGELALRDGTGRASGDFETQVRGQMAVRNAEIVWNDVRFTQGDRVGEGSADVQVRGEISPFSPREDRGKALIRHIDADLAVEGRVATLKPLGVFFSRAKWIEGIDGSGEVSIRVGLEDGVFQPDSRVDVDAERLVVDFLGFRAEGTGHARGKIEEGDEGHDGRIGLAFDEFSWSRREIDQPLVHGAGLSLEAAVDDIQPEAPLSGLRITLDLPDSTAPDLSFLNQVVPGKLGLSLTGGSATFAAHLEATDETEAAMGTFTLRGTDLSGSFRDLDFDLGLELSARLSGRDWDDFQLRLGGTELRITDGVFRHPKIRLDRGWWMTVAIPEGEASLKKPATAIAEVDLSMRDTGAFVALFAELKSWVQRIDGLLTIRNVEGRAVLQFAEKHLTLRELSITGDKLEGQGELDVEERNMAALLRLKYRFLPLALERKDDKLEWKLIKPLQWFRERRKADWLEKREMLRVPEAEPSQGAEVSEVAETPETDVD